MHKALSTVFAISAALFLVGGAGRAQAMPRDLAERPGFSSDDRAAFLDARVAALKAGLKLTAAQEKNWPAFETALRDVATERADRAAEWGAKAKALRESSDALEGMRMRAEAMSIRASELTKLADAAKPLYDSLDATQKRRFAVLLHSAFRPFGHAAHAKGAPGDKSGDND